MFELFLWRRWLDPAHQAFEQHVALVDVQQKNTLELVGWENAFSDVAVTGAPIDGDTFGVLARAHELSGYLWGIHRVFLRVLLIRVRMSERQAESGCSARLTSNEYSLDRIRRVVYQWIMPAPRLNRRENPLRLLRLILGQDGLPMHQELFAARIGVPVATVRAIEAGRRKMTKENCGDQILLTLGAAWNPQEEKWHVLNPYSKWLYEKKHERLVPELDPEDPYLDDWSLHHLVERLLDLFRATNRQQRRGLLLYLNAHFAEIAKQSKLAVDLAPTNRMA